MSLENKDNKQSTLLKKLLNGFGQISRRWKSTNNICSKLNVSTDDLKDADITDSNQLEPTKSFDNLDFIRYIDQISADHIFSSNNYDSKWEVLSQIQHTPRYRHSKTLIPGIHYRSLTDLSNCSKVGSIRCKKRSEKLNDVLDFLLQQVFNNKSYGNDSIKEAIDNLIFESCVEKLLFIIDEYAEAFRQRPMMINSDYLSIVCSTTNSTSDNETVIKPNKKPKPKPELSILSQNSSIIYSTDNSNKQIPKRSKIGLNIQNTLPLTPVLEKSAYRYRARRKSSRKKSKVNLSNEKPRELKNQSSLDIVQNKIKNEYHSYVSAKKDRVSSKPTKETPNLDDHKILSTFHDDEINNKQDKFSKSIDQNIENDIQNNLINEKIKKLSIIQAASVDFSASNNENIKSMRNNANRSLNIQNVGMISLKNKDFKMAPINITYIGDENQSNNNNRIEQNIKSKNSINYKSVCTNLTLNEIGELDNKTMNIYKSTSCHGRSSCDNYSQICSLLKYTQSNFKYQNADTVEKCGEPINFNKLHLVKSDINHDNHISTGLLRNNNEKLETKEELNHFNIDSSPKFRHVKAKFLHNSIPTNYSFCEVNSNETKSNNFEISQSVNIDANTDEIQAIYEKVSNINGFNSDNWSCNRTFSYDDIKKDHDNIKMPSTTIAQTDFSKLYNTSSDDNDDVHVDGYEVDSIDEACELRSMADDFTQYPSTIDYPDIDYIIKDGLQKRFQRSSMVTISPTSNHPLDTLLNCEHSLNYNNDTYPTFTFTGRSKTYSKKKSKTKCIPENLLKHTFASQQKIRVKRDV